MSLYPPDSRSPHVPDSQRGSAESRISPPFFTRYEPRELLELYLYLCGESAPAPTEHLADTWKSIIGGKNHYIIVYTREDKTAFVQWLD